jgi:hypothetical protein
MGDHRRITRERWYWKKWTTKMVEKLKDIESQNRYPAMIHTQEYLSPDFVG